MTPEVKNTCIDQIIQREGKIYTNNPKDRGGPTKFGITLETLAAYRGTKCTAADVQALEESEARSIYEKVFIDDPEFNLINDNGTAALLIDWGVMSGPSHPIKALQTILNMRGAKLKVDGVMGQQTATAANSFFQASALRLLLVDSKILFHIDDVVANPGELRYLRGWVTRTLTFRY